MKELDLSPNAQITSSPAEVELLPGLDGICNELLQEDGCWRNARSQDLELWFPSQPRITSSSLLLELETVSTEGARSWKSNMSETTGERNISFRTWHEEAAECCYRKRAQRALVRQACLGITCSKPGVSKSV